MRKFLPMYFTEVIFSGIHLNRCLGWGSNPHGLCIHRFLRPARIPVPPPRLVGMAILDQNRGYVKRAKEVQSYD